MRQNISLYSIVTLWIKYALNMRRVINKKWLFTLWTTKVVDPSLIATQNKKRPYWHYSCKSFLFYSLCLWKFLFHSAFPPFLFDHVTSLLRPHHLRKWCTRNSSFRAVLWYLIGILPVQSKKRTPNRWIKYDPGFLVNKGWFDLLILPDFWLFYPDFSGKFSMKMEKNCLKGSPEPPLDLLLIVYKSITIKSYTS